MGKVGVASKGPGTEELSELNCHTQDENGGIRSRVMREGQGLSKEDELQVRQHHGSSVCWEEFLSVKSLKVLLVENDDSTRHLVSALLRNCGYEVIAVADGIQAWEILKDHTTRIDLVLTEVVVPCLSGIDLLTKIMDHKTCKNIPVIMMSSYSMTTVLKCLSQGAVDFLVKPIRKNELKNLWQHVWRKCHSPSGSGSGIRTPKSSRSTSVEESDKNTGSNYEDNIESIGRNVRDEGDNGSGTEITQVDNSRPEAFGSDGVAETKTKESLGLDREIGVPGISSLQLEEPNEEGLTIKSGTNKDKFSEMYSTIDEELLEREQPELKNESSNRKLRNQALDLMGAITKSSTKMQGVSKDIKYEDIHESEEIPSPGLSLKTQRDVRNSELSDHDQNVLRHSDQYSAFSRYKSPTTSKQAPSRNVGSYSPLDYSSSAAKSKSLQVIQSNSNSTPLYQHSTGGSNNNDIGSTTNNCYTNKVACEDKLEAKSTIKSLNPSSIFNPDLNSVILLSQPMIQDKSDCAVCNTSLSDGRGFSPQVQLQHHYNHMLDVSQQWHQHQHQHQRQQLVPNHDGLSVKNLAAEATQCGSSNVHAAPMEGNVGDLRFHGSASGSNHSSNGQSGGSSTVNSRGTNMGSDKDVVGEGVIGAIEGGSKNGVDQNHLSQREASLEKFRQKRKERCFEKKVRYQSRKKMAEQRPRVRGQFVRQAVHESKGDDTHS